MKNLIQKLKFSTHSQVSYQIFQKNFQAFFLLVFKVLLFLQLLVGQKDLLLLFLKFLHQKVLFNLLLQSFYQKDQF